MPTIDQVLAQAEALVGSLKGLKGHLQDDAAAVSPDKPLAAVEPLDAGAPDNALPFKCPACGATYEVAVLCSNGHAPEQTIATADVLEGASMAVEAPPVEAQPAQNAVTDTAVTPPPPPAPVQPATTEAPPPSWPDQEDAAK